MPAPAAVFKELHRLRRHAKELQAAIDRLPQQLQALRARAARQEEALREAQETLKKLKVSSREKDLQHRELQELLKRHRAQHRAASTTKEMDALGKEIAHEEQKLKKLEEDYFTTEMDIEERTAKQPEQEQAVKQAQAECAEFEKGSGARKAELAGELERAQGQMKEVEASLPADVQPHYERLVALRGEDALASVAEGNCTACYTELTAQKRHDLMLGQFVVCMSCGRMLYAAE